MPDNITLHHDDLPAKFRAGKTVAIDTETTGLNPRKDRLCLVQLSVGDGTAHLVKIARRKKPAPNLKRLLADKKVEKLFHFARFDLAVLSHNALPVKGPVYCTKIASRLARTHTDKHSLANLVKALLGRKLSKQQQTSDWGRKILTDEQMEYAAGDVLYLHEIRKRLDKMLTRKKNLELARECFFFLPNRVTLDLKGFGDEDIFAHH